MSELVCKNPKCLNKFHYHGKKKKDSERVTCPKCHYRYQLWKLKISLEDWKIKNPLMSDMSNSKNNSKSNPPIKINKPKKVKNLDQEKKEFESYENHKKNNKKSMCSKGHTQDCPEISNLTNKEQGDSKELTSINPETSKYKIPEFEGTVKLCEKHKLPAIYSSFDKKWKCNKCYEEDNARVVQKEEYKPTIRDEIMGSSPVPCMNQESESYKSKSNLPSFPVEDPIIIGSDGEVKND